jgi:hypothetical protein
VLLGVLLDVLGGQLGEGASTALGLFVSRRVLTAGNGQHCFGREHARIRKRDGVGGADRHPARPAVSGINCVPTLVAALTYAQHEAVLLCVPG